MGDLIPEEFHYGRFIYIAGFFQILLRFTKFKSKGIFNNEFLLSGPFHTKSLEIFFHFFKENSTEIPLSFCGLCPNVRSRTPEHRLCHISHTRDHQ